MTDADLNTFQAYVRSLADRMSLKDWRFHITVGQVENQACAADRAAGYSSNATCEVTPGKRAAALAFAETIRSDRADEVRRVVVHELMHCHTAELRGLLRTHCHDAFGTGEFRLFTAAIDQSEELIVDAVSVAWAVTLPLIEWGDGAV